MIGDGDGDDVSTTAADEGPRADPDLPPPTDLSPESVIALYRLYDRTMLRCHIAQPDRPNRGAAPADFFFVVAVEPRDADADEYGYGSFFTVGAVPASGVAIACLPATTVGEDDGEGRECAVCLEAYEAGDAVRTMPCAHGFHERCIFKWLSASRLCPLCRFALPPEEEEEDTDDEDDEEEREAGHDYDGGGALGRLSTPM